jgi:hypothetical protein
MTLSSLDSFGDVAAEDDPVLEYFLSTSAVEDVSNGRVLAVLGRKGTGKTAIVRYLTEGQSTSARALNLRGYPWNVHAARVDHGASTTEAYVSSWRYLLATQLASLALAQPQAYLQESAVPLNNFLRDNYGGTTPQLSDILRPPRIKLSKLSFLPAIMGNQIGGIELDRQGKDLRFGLELSALSDAIVSSALECLQRCGAAGVSVHFDELDQGISHLDDQTRTMLIGLILAARDLKRQSQLAAVPVHPVIYLRSDLWDELQFSDKNKISQTSALRLEWDSTSLKELVELRLRAKLAAIPNGTT